MPVRTKCLFDTPEPEDGLRVLITRWYPRGLRSSFYDEWSHALAPDAALLREYKHGGLPWDRFIARVRDRFETDPLAAKALDKLARVSMHDTVTLLCYEKEGDDCHRHLVKELIDRRIDGTINKRVSAGAGAG